VCSERLLNTAGSSAFISFEGCWIVWIAEANVAPQ